MNEVVGFCNPAGQGSVLLCDRDFPDGAGWMYCQCVSLHGCRAACRLAHIFQFGAKDNWVQKLKRSLPGINEKIID